MNTNDELTDAARAGANKAFGGTFASLSQSRKDAVIANVLGRPEIVEKIVRDNVASIPDDQVQAILADIDGARKASEPEPVDEKTGAKLHVGGRPVDKAKA